MMNTMEQVQEVFDNWNNENKKEELYDIMINRNNHITGVKFGSSIEVTEFSIIRKLIRIKDPKYSYYTIRFKIPERRKDIFFKIIYDILPLRRYIQHLNIKYSDGCFLINIYFWFR